MRKVLFLLAICASLSACDSSVNVNATANVPAEYSSVLVTVKEVWFNESATAVPEDTTWQKFPLAEPVTLELAEDLSGTLSDVASQLKLPTGEYRQVRLYLADRSETLTSSASSASATFNNQVTFSDANGTENTLPLEIPNAAQGIGIQTDLKVKAATDAILASVAGANGATSGTTTGLTNGGSTIIGGTTGSTTGSTINTGDVSDTTDTGTIDTGAGTSTGTATGTRTGTTTGNGAGASIGTSTGTATSSDASTTTNDTTLFASSGNTDTTVTATSQLVFDAARDLTPFQFSDTAGFLLNPTIAAYDSDQVGTIQGQLDLSALTLSEATTRPDLQVTAEKLSDDSTRRVIVANASVSANGTFVLYPLPIDSSKSDATTYDLVMHGPGVRTVILRNVPVTRGEPGSATDISIGNLAMTPADSYAVNLASDSTVGARGSRVGFYQTLPDDEAPYLIELRTVDPLTGRFAADEAVSGSPTVIFGTYSGSFSFQEAAPREGASKYSVAVQAPLFAEGAFASTSVAPPVTAGTTSTFTVPAAGLPDTASSGTIAAALSIGTPGKYDKGALFVTHDGAVVAVASLDDTLAQSQPSATVNVTDVPANTATGGYYYVEAWAWSSSDPAGTFTRQSGGSAVDLRTALNASTSVAVN